jgi:hypothetical protein
MRQTADGFIRGQDKKMAAGTYVWPCKSIVSLKTTNKKHLSNKAAGLAIRGFIGFRFMPFAMPPQKGGCIAPVQLSLLT